jgi:hypothetical protein
MTHLREIDGDNLKEKDSSVQYQDSRIPLQEAEEKVEAGRGRYEIREQNGSKVLHEKEHLR